MYFSYGKKETEYLKQKDKRLAEVIDTVGPIRRTVDPDLFAGVVHQIVGQQISTAALRTVWKRFRDALGEVSPETITAASTDDLQQLGLSYRKVGYIKEFAGKVADGSFDLAGLPEKSDAEAIAQLTTLRGVGVWTAEMLLLFCLERPDVFSYDDLALQRGLRMVYHHRAISRELFEKYRRRYSPYGSVASLYLWEVAGGALEERKEKSNGKKS